MSRETYQQQLKTVFSRESSLSCDDPYAQMQRVMSGKNMANPFASSSATPNIEASSTRGSNPSESAAASTTSPSTDESRRSSRG